MKKKLVIIGVVFLSVAFFLIAAGLVSEKVNADGASGTWTGTCTVETGAANFYYDVTLTLNGESSVSGTLSLYCTDVNIKISGFEESMNMIGTTTNDDVEGDVSGSTLTLYVYDSSGTYTFTMIISGSTMTGGGSYDSYGAPVTWSFDLTSGGGFGGLASFDLSSLGAPSAAIAVIGGLSGLAVSYLPGPKYGEGGRGQRSVPTISRGAAIIRNRGPFNARGAQISRPDPHRPFNARPQNQPSPATQTTQTQTPKPQATPLADPNQTLNMPTLPLGATIGPHLVPYDAPMQCPPNQNPRDYPYGRGTSSTMKCPYCGFNTLSPFTTGWFCTNTQCPARRDLLLRRQTRNDFHHMTWRRL